MGNLLWVYADADYTGDPDMCRSVTGYVVMMDGGAISWSSTRQAVVALSSSDAELYTASNCVYDISHMCMVMDQLGYPQTEPTVMFKDNWA